MFNHDKELESIGFSMAYALLNLRLIRKHILKHKLDMACPVCKEYINISQAISETMVKLNKLEKET